MLFILSLLFGVAVSAQAPAASVPLPLTEWQVQANDRFIADTKQNMGYLVHEDGRYASFRIGSGQRRVVSYIGRTYNATTPVGYWKIKSLHRKGRSVTFGNGRFLRMYKDGDAYTAYGIHATSNIDDILSWETDDRYVSYGCILVSEEVLNILEAAYILNGEMLEIVTVQGIDATSLSH